VVDNNSKDNTFHLVSTYLAAHENVRYVTESKQGLSHARNRGCDEARGKYLAYLDDDAKAPQGYLSEILKLIDEHSPDILGGPIYPYYTSKKAWWFTDDYEIREYASQSGFIKICRASGGNFVIRKDLLVELGMFDPDFGMVGGKIGLGEERVLFDSYRDSRQKDQLKFYYSMEAYVEHHVPSYKMTITYMLKRYYTSGRTAAIIKNKDPAGAIERIQRFIPNTIRYAWNEIKAKGVFRANYLSILFEMALRFGNIAGLFRYGPGPVFKPWIRHKHKQVRVWCKNKPLVGRLFYWLEDKFGFKP
jgi:glycosyltransferase involved in cell wall biosynthesis